MTDLQRAISLLHRPGYTCILCDRDRVLTSKKNGIAPLLERYEEGEDCRGMSVADHIVGKAAAMLLVLMQVREVHGDVMSTEARRLLKKYGIEAEWGTLVPQIINRRGDGPCPMECTVADLTDPEDAPAALRATLERLKQNESTAQ